MEVPVGELIAKLERQIASSSTSHGFTSQGSFKPGQRCLLYEENPTLLIALLCSVWRAGALAFLASESWSAKRCEDAFSQVQPHAIWQHGIWLEVEPERDADLPRADALPQGSLGIATGGSGGSLKYSLHSAESLTQAAERFTGIASGKSGYAYSCLPVWHISGFMPWVRSALQGGRTIPLDWKSLEAGHFPIGGSSSAAKISLVPTQLAKLLQVKHGKAWLTSLSPVLLGGAACDETLLAEARKAGIEVCQVYGATETAAAVAATSRNNWKTGSDTALETLPGVEFHIHPKTHALSITGAGLHHGYWPAIQKEPLTSFDTGDLADKDNSGRCFRILGRRDSQIITGGEKVDPQVVSSAIREQLGAAYECAVFGVADALWGQRVVAAIAPQLPPDQLEKVKAVLKENLARWEVPKRWLSLESLPRTKAGKIDSEQLQALHS